MTIEELVKHYKLAIPPLSEDTYAVLAGSINAVIDYLKQQNSSSHVFSEE